jgi:uncharacterized membrane protein YphA (DoxX/SURF4 family)
MRWSQFLKINLSTIASFLFIILFVYAAVSKLFDFSSFNAQLAQSPLLTGFTGWVIWIIPTIEIMIAILLAIDHFRLMGLYAAFSLMVMFTAYIIAILNFTDYIPCSCGGVLQHMSWKTHLIFNIGFVLLAAVGISFSAQNRLQKTK